ncbi:hypothetical protein [Algoriphagus sp. NG3]|uniref:hypothetical protein n=1 Tax=Algoriphagus sp. NG3 TaxID=3097546 RepID=UPI002A831F51|nr:hypothetical protein [Algoriphagus sp. NG3]WPR75227.1 hypothetical protein SLW71_21430 [Algoriphagus sp. NG3]
MDITKFLSILDSETLYFPRADKLGDPFEGSYTKKSIVDRNDGGKNYSKWYEDLKTKMLISCWHMNNYESEAMWKLYLKSDEGIAIQSTYRRLKNSFNIDDNYHTQIGVVEYLDYEIDSFQVGNTFNPFLRKRKSFEHERELRAIIDLGTWNPGSNSAKERVDFGKYIRADIHELIESIYVAPYSPDWMNELVESLIKRFDFSFKVNQSSMKIKPTY